MHLFWSTRALTAAREDHLTEFLAAALDVSEHFRRAYADLVIRDWANAWGRSSQIVSVTTQVSFANTTCCPDMVFILSDGSTVACEHKLDSEETTGPDADPRAQLVRYLDLPVDGVVYVRTSWKLPAAEVLSNRKYIPPQDREHFLAGFSGMPYYRMGRTPSVYLSVS